MKNDASFQKQNIGIYLQIPVLTQETLKAELLKAYFSNMTTDGSRGDKHSNFLIDTSSFMASFSLF